MLGRNSNASGQSSASFGGYFIDVAEPTATIAVGYECLYDAWADQQKEIIRTAISSPSAFNMPRRIHEQRCLPLVVDRSRGGRPWAGARPPRPPPRLTVNYWYFSPASHAEMASSSLSAIGSSYGPMDSNQLAYCHKMTSPTPPRWAATLHQSLLSDSCNAHLQRRKKRSHQSPYQRTVLGARMSAGEPTRTTKAIGRAAPRVNPPKGR